MSSIDELAAQQLPLQLGFSERTCFGNYIPGANEEVVLSLKGLPEQGEAPIYLWGRTGTGKTHLLQASCQAVSVKGYSAVYLPLSRAEDFSPEILEGLEKLALVCLDDVHSIAGKREWELALFGLLNQVHEHDTCLVTAGSAPPAKMGLGLPDLASRLAGSVGFHLLPLKDEDKLQALCQRAYAQGFFLPRNVARYLLTHCSRDLPGLLDLLNRLDQASLTVQRKLTLPMVRKLLDRFGG